jgi:hypothetical protein
VNLICLRTLSTETWRTTIAPDAVSRELLRSSILAPCPPGESTANVRAAWPAPSCPAGGRAKRKPDPGVGAPLVDLGLAGLGTGTTRDAGGPTSQPLSRTDCGRPRRDAPSVATTFGQCGSKSDPASSAIADRIHHLSDRHEPMRRSARQRMTCPDPFQSGATVMRYMMPIGTLCMFGVGLTFWRRGSPRSGAVRTNRGRLRECGVRARRGSPRSRPEGGLHQPHHAGRAAAASRQQTSGTSRSASGGLQSKQPPLWPTKGLAGGGAQPSPQ